MGNNSLWHLADAWDDCSEETGRLGEGGEAIQYGLMKSPDEDSAIMPILYPSKN